MIPDRSLNFRPAELELDDYFWLEEFMSDGREIHTADVRRFLDIVASASDWTREEMGRVRIRELGEVFRAIRQGEEVEAEKAVPPQTETSSPSMPQATETSSPSGPPSVRSRRRGASRPMS